MNFLPINLFVAKNVLAGFVIAYLLAGSPVILYPYGSNATYDGVVLDPSAFCITTG